MMDFRKQIGLLILLFSLAACETQEDLQEQVKRLIDERVESRLDKYTETMRNRCEERILTEATRIVDSILIERARMAKDTILKPVRVDRPDLPELKTLSDTTPVAPLFPEGLPVDSLPAKDIQ